MWLSIFRHSLSILNQKLSQHFSLCTKWRLKSKNVEKESKTLINYIYYFFDQFNPILHGIFFLRLPREVGLWTIHFKVSGPNSFLHSYLYIYLKLKSKRTSLWLQNSRDERRSKSGHDLDEHGENSKIKNLRRWFWQGSPKINRCNQNAKYLCKDHDWHTLKVRQSREIKMSWTRWYFTTWLSFQDAFSVSVSFCLSYGYGFL